MLPETQLLLIGDGKYEDGPVLVSPLSLTWLMRLKGALLRSTVLISPPLRIGDVPDNTGLCLSKGVGPHEVNQG